VLSAQAFDELWRAEQLGSHHTALDVASQVLTSDERRQRRDDAFAELANGGLLTNGRPHPDLRDALHLIANAAHELYGWITDRGGDLGAVSAVSGMDAVLAVKTTDALRLEPIRPTAAADALVAQLPPLRAAAGRSISLPATAMNEAGEPVAAAGQQEGFGGLAGPSISPDAVRLARLLREPRIGGGQFYAAVRDHTGKRIRCASPLSYFDTERGRWFTAVEGNSRGDQWIVVTRATPDFFATKLRATVATLC
jgi:hypothetical protein